MKQKAELNHLISNDIEGNSFSQQRLNYRGERNLGFTLIKVYDSSVGYDILKVRPFHRADLNFLIIEVMPPLLAALSNFSNMLTPIYGTQMQEYSQDTGGVCYFIILGKKKSLV